MGLVIKNGGGGGLQSGRGGTSEVLPTHKGWGQGPETVLATLKGGGGEQVLMKYQHRRLKFCTKPLSTIQCNKTLCQDQLGLYYS